MRCTPLLSLAATLVVSAQTTTRPELIYSKGFGGSGSDQGTAVAVDKDGNVYVTGTTTSRDFPVLNGFQRQLGGSFIHMSMDNGKTWSVPNIPSAVYSAASSAKAPNVIYVGTSAGLYKSTDGLKTFRLLTNAFSEVTVNATSVDKDNPSLIFAATAYGFYRSLDAGVTWSGSNLSRPLISLAINPSKPSTFIVTSAQRQSYRSTDSGVSWTQLKNAPANLISLACEPLHPDVFYGGSNNAIYKTADGGDTWTKLMDASMSYSAFSLAANSVVIYAATTKGILRSIDGGINWLPTLVTAAADNLAVDPNNPLVAYANAGGIWMTTDGGVTWTSKLSVRQSVQTIAVLATAPATVIVGSTQGKNAFVTKWSADGKQMLYSTFLGGSSEDRPTAIAVDKQGNAYVTGYTSSTDFPITTGSLQIKNSGARNGFIAKLDASGSSLIFSTYLGGSSDDRVRAIALDSSGNAYVTGQTTSQDFPATSLAVQSKLRSDCPNPDASLSFSPLGPADAFAAKISADGGLRYATFLGGNCEDDGKGIAVDSAGSAWIVGNTLSSDFYRSSTAIERGDGTVKERGFLVKLSPTGNDIAYASYIGDQFPTSSTAIALDDKGNVYLAGAMIELRPIFPFLGLPSVGVGATLFDPFGSGADCEPSINGSTYALKLDPTGTSRIFMKSFGDRFATICAIAVDQAGRVWISGTTLNSIFFATPEFSTVHPFRTIGTGFLSELSQDGSRLLFSSRTQAPAMFALDSAGNAFLTGRTMSDIFTGYKSSAALIRVDGALKSSVTVEPPQPIVEKLHYPAYFDAGVAGCEIIAINGSGLGPSEEITAQLTPQGKVPTSLGGSSIFFDGVPAPILSAQDERIVCVVPLAVGQRGFQTTMQVERNGSKANAILMGATSQAIEVLAIANSDGIANSSSKPAGPGSVITIYVAGFGPTIPQGVDGETNGTSNRSLFYSPQVKFAGQKAEVLFAGTAPGQVNGIVQINLRVPQVAPGQYPIYIGLNLDILVGIEFNPAYVSIGPM